MVVKINHKLTAYAWKDMFEDSMHTFWRNNEIACESAIMHAIVKDSKIFECGKVLDNRIIKF